MFMQVQSIFKINVYLLSVLMKYIYDCQLKQDDPDFLSMIPDQEMNDHIASLRYAGMIQNALMPDPEILRGYLQDFFVLFLPRDIVSGDFYYAFCNRQKMCIAAGDCTGHGVPGALMSILG